MPGEVLISHDTYRHVRGVFKVKESDITTGNPLSRGVRKTKTYSVADVKPRAFRMRTRGVEGSRRS
ncbi:MAG: hypothetical protein IPM63_18755 [Acidobacteriota bacterium]|nr:MAG: hypothetical protein IPM63_18755 [Acidobacteriota bacterium]